MTIKASLKRFIGLKLTDLEVMRLSAKHRERCYKISGESKLRYIEWLNKIRKQWAADFKHNGLLNTHDRNRCFDLYVLEYALNQKSR